MHICRILPLAGLLLLSPCLWANDSAMDAYLKEVFPASDPGGAVLVQKDGEILLRAGYGMANLEHDIAIEPDMVFRLGSITKQFTAVAIMRLVEAGKIDLQASIRTYLPDYPEHADAVTVEHLLTHTSGIVSYTGMQEWVPRMREDLSTDEMLAIFQDKPLEFEPGARYRYNNSGYFLLGVIIEKVSGQTYGEHLEETIFKPLNMQRSYYGNARQVIADRVQGYEGAPGRWVNASYLSMTQPYAAGSLLSTVDDLAKWDAALKDDTLLSDASRQTMFTPYTTSEGQSTNYGYGWELQTVRGFDAIRHGGGINGFVTDILRIPSEDLLVVVLTNVGMGGFRPGHVSQRLAAMALGQPYPDFSPITLSAETLQEYVGVYKIEATDEKRIITVEDGQLYSKRGASGRLPVTTFAKDKAAFNDSLVYMVFQRDETGKVNGLITYQGGETPEPAKLTEEAVPEAPKEITLTAEELAAYVGEYTMELPGAPVMTVSVEDSRIFAQLTGQGPLEIFAKGDDHFFTKAIEAEIAFRRDDSSKVTQLILRQNGREMAGNRK